MSNVKAFITDVNRDGFHEVAEAIRAVGGKDAEDINYDNSVSGLDADNVQAAIDEVAGDVGDLVTAVSGKVSKSGDTMTGKLTVNNDVQITGDLIAPYANIATLNYRDPLTDKLLNVIAPNVINTGGTLQFPDKGGTLATTSDILDSADEITFNNTGTSLTSTNIEDAIKEVNTTYTSFNVTAENASGVSDCVIDTQQNYTKNGIAFIAITLHAVSNTTDIDITLPNNITFKQNGIIGICGKGGRWSVSNVQYLYIKSNGLSLNRITANAYYHIVISLPANVS